MAYETGTSTNAADLYADLITFLTTNVDLVAASQEWSIVWTHAGGQESGVVLSGPGLAGTDSVLVGMKLISDALNDEYRIEVVGMTGIIPTALTIFEHVNVAPHRSFMFLDSNPMTRWFVANGRRFVVVAKMSTVYEAMYAGFFLPYAFPDQYTYPLFIGGSASDNNQGLDSWRSTAAQHRHFPWGYYHFTDGGVSFACQTVDPEGNWVIAAATGPHDGNMAIGPTNFQSGDNYAYQTGAGGNRVGIQGLLKRMRAGFGGEFMLTPFTLTQRTPSDQTYGILEGCYLCPGFGNSAENIITVDGVDHLVVQDVFRTDWDNYWALALE